MAQLKAKLKCLKFRKGPNKKLVNVYVLSKSPDQSDSEDQKNLETYLSGFYAQDEDSEEIFNQQIQPYKRQDQEVRTKDDLDEDDDYDDLSLVVDNNADYT